MNRKSRPKTDKRLPEAFLKPKEAAPGTTFDPSDVLGNRAIANMLGNGTGTLDGVDASGQPSADHPSEVLASLGEGRALEGGLGAEASTLFGVSPHAVRVHDDPAAAALARKHNAKAVTVGNHIAFGAGEYKPGTPLGDAILVHELAHVAQQRGTAESDRRPSPVGDEALERDANQSAIGAMENLKGGELGAKAMVRGQSRPAMQSGARLSMASCGKDKEAELKANQVLTFIRDEAKKRAAHPPSLSPDSNFYKRLKGHYLADYLQNPSEATGREAIAGIGRPMEGRRGAGGIEVKPQGGAWRGAKGKWEKTAIETWNKQPIGLPSQVRDKSLFRNIKTLPSTLEAGTDILISENVQKLPYVDSPFLLGKPNLATAMDFDADWKYGGQNISQLMHWATGVKYSGQDADAMHELFLAYESWHLEGWDVFGQDSINDMLAEEQGRILGSELAKGASGAIKKEEDLLPFLNRSFLQSRAWVGSLLRLRQRQLDDWILAEEQPKANVWYQKEASLWRTDTVYTMLAGGARIEDVEKSDLVQAQIEIYTLIYEAENWEKAEGKINITPLQKALVEGKLNHILKVMAKGPNATSGDKIDAWSNLKELKD